MKKEKSLSNNMIVRLCVFNRPVGPPLQEAIPFLDLMAEKVCKTIAQFMAERLYLNCGSLSNADDMNTACKLADFLLEQGIPEKANFIGVNLSSYKNRIFFQEDE